MPSISQEMQEFLDHYLTKKVSTPLALEMIAKFGGETAFLEKYNTAMHVGLYSSTGEWADDKAIAPLYQLYSSEMIDVIRGDYSEHGWATGIDMTGDFDGLKDTYDLDEIAEGMYQEQSSYRIPVGAAIARYMGEHMCFAYNEWLSTKK